MSQLNCDKLLRLCVGAVVALPVAATLALLPASASQFLKGNVQDSGVINPGNAGPALNRNDVGRLGDPFGNSGGNQPLQGEAFDAPSVAFQVPTIAPPTRRVLSGNAQDEGSQPNFSQMQPTPDAVPQNFQQPPMQSFQQPNGNVSDPDDTAEMKLAWDTWHHNVAQTIYQRFNTLSSRFFAKGAPLAACIAYTVTRDGHVTNVHLTQKSPNIIFNTMIITVVNSINGDQSVLPFPQGSRRMTVEKAGDFKVGYDNIDGFKYIQGDQETLRTTVPHQQQRSMMQQAPMQQRSMMQQAPMQQQWQGQQ
jgi:hypothetical protein